LCKGLVFYADAFVVATAVEFSATIVTGDQKFRETEARAAVLWL